MDAVDESCMDGTIIGLHRIASSNQPPNAQGQSEKQSIRGSDWGTTWIAVADYRGAGIFYFLLGYWALGCAGIVCVDREETVYHTKKLYITRRAWRWRKAGKCARHGRK